MGKEAGSNLVTTLIGSFSGASLAFMFNRYLQRRKQVEEDIATGTLALFAISSLFDDFHYYRFAIRGGLQKVEVAMPDAPWWFLPRPIGFEFRDSDVFDFKGLAFLLVAGDVGVRAEGRVAFASLQFVEKTYRDLHLWHTQLHLSARQLQEDMAKAYMGGLSHEASNAEIEEKIGPELVSRLKSQLQAVVKRLEFDELRYVSSYLALNDAMEAIFGPKARMPALKIREEFKAENLPAWPPRVKAFLDGIRQAEVAAFKGYVGKEKSTDAGFFGRVVAWFRLR
jgi:hypothetical protein